MKKLKKLTHDEDVFLKHYNVLKLHQSSNNQHFSNVRDGEIKQMKEVSLK